MRFLSNADVQQVLDVGLAIESLEAIFTEMAQADAVGMGRIDVYIPSTHGDAPYYRWAIMAGGSTSEEIMCARMISDIVEWPRVNGRARENKFAREPGTYCGFMLLFSSHDAVPLAIINDGILQHVRVGAGAGLGVKHLSRRDSQIVGMIGSGGMARTYLDAFCAVRDVRRVKVYSPNQQNTRSYADEMSAAHDIDVVPVESAREAVSGVDIASCCTSSTEPVFRGDWLESGVHVTNVTSSEIEGDLIDRVDVALRAGEATPRLERLPDEAAYARGGFLSYIAGQPAQRDKVPRLSLPRQVANMPTLVDLLRGITGGRTNDAQSSFFLNVGAIGAQFAAVAAMVYKRAEERGLGEEVPTEMFLQDVRD